MKPDRPNDPADITARPFASIRVQDLQADDRPREKALRQGVRALSDTELLAIVLGGGLPGMSVLDMSRDILLRADNSLVELSRMQIAEMKRKFKGVGDAKATLVAAVFEIGRRWRDQMAASARNERAAIRSSEDVYRLMRSGIEHLPYEEFWIMMLSRANTVMETRCVSRGGTASTVVDVKLLMRHVIDTLAPGIVLVHNHPSGSLNPSAHDDALTRRILGAAKLLDVNVIDHVIISASGYYSYADRGRLSDL